MQPHPYPLLCRFMAQTAERDRRASGAPAADHEPEQPPQKPLEEMTDKYARFPATSVLAVLMLRRMPCTCPSTGKEPQ